MNGRSIHVNTSVSSLCNGISRRKFLSLSGTSALGVATLGAFGCGGENVGGGGGEGGAQVFTFAQGLDALSLDPPNQTDDTSSAIAAQIFDTLITYAPEGSALAPALLQSVPESEDGGREYTLELRENVTFHDGSSLNADAVAANFDRWRNTDDPLHGGGGAQSSDFSNYALLFGGFDDESIIREVRALDDRTVLVRLREPLGSFLTSLAEVSFSIASPKALEDNLENFWQEPVGTGPFKLEQWDRGGQVALEKNPQWWGTDLSESDGGGGPQFDRVVFRSIPDNASRVAALVSGNVSGADGIVPDDLPTIEDNPDLKVLFRPPLTSGHLAINMEKEPFGDPTVRRAVAHAINVPQLIETFFGDTGEEASGPMSSGLSFFDESIEPYGYDPDESRRLLDEAGLGDGFETELWYISIPRPYMPDGRGVAQAIQRDLDAVGIDAKLVTYEFGTYLEKLGEGEHALALYGGTDVGTDPDFRLTYWFSSAAATETSATNISYYKSPEIDELLSQARGTVDQDERERSYSEIQTRIHEDVPIVPIAYVRPPLGLQENVEGYNITFGGDRLNRAHFT